MRKRTALMLAIVVAVAVLLGMRPRCGRTAANSAARDPGDLTKQHSEVHRAMTPSWMAQHDVHGRRVAGRVEHAGRPVAGAVVRLALQDRDAILEGVAEVRTDAKGGFDFDLQPPVTVNVSAESPGYTPAAVTVAVADPRSKPDEIVLELEQCRAWLYGAVLDASGGFIAKARLTTAGLGGVESDVSGRYKMCVQRPRATVRVDAAGYGALTTEVIIAGAVHYDFVLVPEAVIAGHVITDAKLPVATARVSATPEQVDRLRHLASAWAETDDAGRFSLRGLAPGRYRLRADAAGLSTPVPVDAVADSSGATRDLTITVHASGTVTGHVMMANRPVAGAQVAAVRGGVVVSSTSYSQQDGSFVLSDVPRGTVTFIAPPFEVRSPVSLSITSATLDGVTITVTERAAIRGRVTRHGKPAAGAEVVCDPGGAVTRSDAAGMFALDGLPEGAVDITASDAESKALSLAKRVTLSAGEKKQVDIELDRSGEAAGVVVDQLGRPVPDVYVRMQSAEGTNDVAESMTDVAGQFACSLMIGGEYMIAVYPLPTGGRRFGSATGEPFPTVHVPQDGATTGITLAIADERFTIRGMVTDDAGVPMADVGVEAPGGWRFTDLPATVTDSSGHFLLANVASGVYLLRAHAADGSAGEVAGVRSGSDDVVIRVQRSGAIEGTLVNFSAAPLVQITKLSPDRLAGITAIVDGDRFWQRGLSPGRYSVQARAGVELDGGELEVQSGETAQMTLRSRGVSRIGGSVNEFGTEVPVAGAQCEAKLTIIGPGTDSSMQAVTQPDGRFVLDAPIGKVRVICVPSDPTLSIAGGEVDIGQSGGDMKVFSVRSKFGAGRGSAGYGLTPGMLPLTIGEVTAGALKQGLHVGDRLVAIDGASIQGLLPMGAMFLLWNHRPGTTIMLGVERAGEAMTFNLPVSAGLQ